MKSLPKGKVASHSDEKIEVDNTNTIHTKKDGNCKEVFGNTSNTPSIRFIYIGNPHNLDGLCGGKISTLHPPSCVSGTKVGNAMLIQS